MTGIACRNNGFFHDTCAVDFLTQRDQRGVGLAMAGFLRLVKSRQVRHVLRGQHHRLGRHQRVLALAFLETFQLLDQVSLILAGQPRPGGIYAVAVCAMAGGASNRFLLACCNRSLGESDVLAEHRQYGNNQHAIHKDKPPPAFWRPR